MFALEPELTFNNLKAAPGSTIKLTRISKRELFAKANEKNDRVKVARSATKALSVVPHDEKCLKKITNTVSAAGRPADGIDNGYEDAQGTVAAASSQLRTISCDFRLFEKPQRFVEIQANFSGSRCVIGFSEHLFVNFLRHIF